MGKQTVTLILDYLRTHPGMHATSEVAERTGTSPSTASRNLALLWKWEPGIERIRAGIYMYRTAEHPPGGPHSNGAAPAPAALPFPQEPAPRGGRDAYATPARAVQAEPDERDEFSPTPRYGPPFRIRIESSFVARSGRTCYRIRAEGGREGTMFWEDEPWRAT